MASDNIPWENVWLIFWERVTPFVIYMTVQYNYMINWGNLSDLRRVSYFSCDVDDYTCSITTVMNGLNLQKIAKRPLFLIIDSYKKIAKKDPNSIYRECKQTIN